MLTGGVHFGLKVICREMALRMKLSLFVAIVYLFVLANAASRQKKQDIDGFEYNCIHDQV